MWTIQEHHLEGSDDIAEAQDWLKARGFVSLFAPALRTSAGGTSGGVAVIAADCFGLRHVDCSLPDDLRHRALLAGYQLADGQYVAISAM